ncbi:Bug family tripartite tricarboxylate transporter substrate binding protein [Falsiroseomonas oryziterrae]|uniref:Bug family tripartite tricarboxylate transporter substrate binding protein n=1 Tax=Falsiroseomonas oryziterrae TaxID=2911368 RepID=UPI001F4402EF|nr:tripartite tricarboxylate transporter substrate binding protein [Roseomonas sp. NPKOSM-4]
MLRRLFVLLAALAPWSAQAQGWQPTRPIEIVVPFTAGSLADRNMRAAAPLLSRDLGVPVAVQNVPGATGYNRIFRAAPDGHTLGAGDPVAQMGLALVQPQPFDVLRLTWLGHWSSGVQTLVASSRGRVQSLEQLRGLRQPVRCGTFGGISTGAMQCALLGRALGFNVAFVSVQGPPELVLAAVRGDVDLASLGPTLWTDHIAAGAVRPLLSWDARRDDRLPEVPSLSDVNLQSFSDVTVIRGVAAPPELPAAIRDRLIAALNNVTRQPEWEAFVAQARLERDWVFSADYPQTLQRAQQLLNDNAAVLRSAF